MTHYIHIDREQLVSALKDNLNQHPHQKKKPNIHEKLQLSKNKHRREFQCDYESFSNQNIKKSTVKCTRTIFFLSHFTHKRIGTKLVNDNSRLLFIEYVLSRFPKLSDR